MDPDSFPDIHTVPAELIPPPMINADPEAGRRVRQVVPEYAGTGVHHALYLPPEWRPGQRYPVLVEYAGNGPYQDARGDTCSGRVEDMTLGFGISGGSGCLWLGLPFVSLDHRQNQLQWWGDVAATVAYCHAAVAHTCAVYGGDPGRLILSGFSRGAIAANFIGLYDDATAALWRGFICHSHYDGVRPWGYAGGDRPAAATRLARLCGRPQFISHEGSVDETRQYLAAACPNGAFTFLSLPYRNHTAAWVLRDIPARRALREWLARVLA